MTVDDILQRLIAAWPGRGLPTATYALYREKLANVPTDTLAAVVEALIEKGGPRIPHVGEIIAMCKATGGGVNSAQAATPWEFAGMPHDAYVRLPVGEARHHAERWAAHVEAVYRLLGKTIPRDQSQFPDGLDAALDRLGLDSRGRPVNVDYDPLGLNRNRAEPEDPLERAAQAAQRNRPPPTRPTAPPLPPSKPPAPLPSRPAPPRAPAFEGWTFDPDADPG